MGDKDQLARLDEVVIEEILQKTNEEMLADVPAVEIDRLASLFSQAKAAHGRARLKRAQVAVVRALPPEARGADFRRPDRKTITTIAARGARGDSGADQVGIDEDMEELRAQLEGEEN